MYCPGFFVSIVGIFDSSVRFPRATKTQNRQVPMYEFEFFTSDTPGTAFIDDRGYPMTYGTCICAKPGQLRRSILPFRCHYFHLEVTDPELNSRLAALPDVLNLYQMSEVKAIFGRIFALETQTRLEDLLMLQGYICQILSILLRAAQMNSAISTAHSQTVVVAEQYIRGHLQEELSLGSLAAVCNLSPTYFHKIFTQLTGKTPARYILDCRIATAKTGLLSREFSLTELAEQCGFSSQSYFCYKFKQVTGMTPMQYRSEMLSRPKN